MSTNNSNSHVSKINWLRAGVLGANDGIVSTAGLVMGVAGATGSIGTIITAGLAGIIAGSISMAAGEYVSVSSSRDMEKAMLEHEKKNLRENPKQELEELATIYEKKGLKKSTALTVAKELTEHDPLKAHYDAELQIDPENLTKPWDAAFASAISFIIGALIPLTAILIPPESIRIPFAFISVIMALILTGAISAKIGKANKLKAMLRVTIGGVCAMTITYFIGKIFGQALI